MADCPHIQWIPDAPDPVTGTVLWERCANCGAIRPKQ